MRIRWPPPPIGAFVPTTLMNVGFVAIFRTYTIIASTSILPWANDILLSSGTLSVFVATVYFLRVNHSKRMSAYSSLENMGIVAIGLGAGGIGYFYRPSASFDFSLVYSSEYILSNTTSASGL